MTDSNNEIYMYTDSDPEIEGIYKPKTLHGAAYEDNYEAAKVLLRKGAAINLLDLNGDTALHIAVMKHSNDFVRFLIDQGADVNCLGSEGLTPLLLACSYFNYDIAKRLLEAGANVDAADDKGRTALHHACIQEREGMVDLLFQYGAQADPRDNSGRTPLRLALARHQSEMLNTLLHHGANVNAVDPEGRAPLHYAAKAGWTRPMHALLRPEVDVDAKDADGNTALHLACLGGFKQVMWLLLEHGASVHVKDSDGLTALQLASSTGQSASIVRLLQHYEAKADAENFSKARSRSVSPPRRLRIMRSTSTILEPKEVEVESVSSHEIPRLRKTETGSEPSHDRLEPTDEMAVGSEIDSAQKMLGQNHWDGVRRDNGDGYILAKYDGHDIYCDAKMESIHSSSHEGQEMHAIQLKLNFMKPHSLKHRIRYAEVDVALYATDLKASPNIRTIMPQADRVEVSEQEITTGQKFTVGANGNGGPSSVNISMEGSKGRKSTFKGVRIIHGAVKDRMHASWRLYEEPGSKSGLPEIVRLLLVVQCEAEFELRASLSARASHFFSFGIPRTVTARKGPAYLVPPLAEIMSLEQAMKLKLILGVAERAAVMVEDAKRLEQRVTQSIKEHTKRALIMEAGASESNIRDWADIADASSYGDFALLCEKLLRTREIESPEVRPRPRRWSPAPVPIVERSRSRWRRESLDFDGDDRGYARRMRARLGVDEAEEAIAPTQRSRNVHGFSAVGPGYKVSRLA